MSAGAKDPRSDNLSLISLDSSSVKLSPPIIFLFGGRLDPAPQSKLAGHFSRLLSGVIASKAAKKPSSSVRAAIYDYICAKHSRLSESLVVPEEFKDWLHDSVYPDLTTFERDLAQTASLVIIALESPGAIAELGSFSVNETLSHKVITVLSDHHNKQESFIKLGPMRLLEKDNIYSYPYNHKKLGNTLDEYLSDFVSKIDETLSKGPASEAFQKDNNGHVTLLIYELLSVFKALKIREIHDYLELLGAKRKMKEIQRFLFVLDKLDLVRMQQLSNVDFFYARRSQERIAFGSSNTKKPFDKKAAIIGAGQFYKSSDKEKMRKKVIEDYVL